MCASACPPGKKKTLLDAKDGYHSVVLSLGEIREVTEFLCEFDQYQCIGSGQGLICSGDAYTHRFDNITSKLTNVVQCTDDSLLWEDDLTCRYLSLCDRGGINFNRKKFRFAKDRVNYVSFTLTEDAIRSAHSMT